MFTKNYDGVTGLGLFLVFNFLCQSLKFILIVIFSLCILF